MQGAHLLIAFSFAGCLASELPPDQYVARRHACTQLEGQTFVSPIAGRVTVSSDDAAYSSYEWTHTDDAVTAGLVQCEDTAATTLLFVDVANAASGRTEMAAFGPLSLTWFGAHFDAATSL